MSKEFETKLNKKQDYGTGATRDAAAGKGRFDLIPDLALERVAKVYERGGAKHGFRNWEQGIPMSRMIDSALRHIRQYQMSKYIPELREEDHLAHAVWNLLGVLHEEEMIEREWLPKELDDLPRYGYVEGKPTFTEEEIEKERGKLKEVHVDILWPTPLEKFIGRYIRFRNGTGGEISDLQFLSGGVLGVKTINDSDGPWRGHFLSENEFRGYLEKGTKEDEMRRF